jgi:dipeptidyl aminopeptidase/acylaminoacyl peptidase
MPKTQIAPYGSWKSPISAEMVFAKANRLIQPLLSGQTLYWIEGRAEEAGRQVIMRRTPDGKIEDCIPPGFNARTRVHEYGGGDYTVAGGEVFFANYADQRLYRCRPGQTPTPLTPAGPLRFADFVYDPCQERLICVCEDHTRTAAVTNRLVSIRLADGEIQTLVQGRDFYAAPCLSPDGGHLAWLAWDHPNMPWDGCELWTAEVRGDGKLDQFHHPAGGPQESICQPEWSPDGELYFVSDRSGWWNLYRWLEHQVEHLWEIEAEFGQPHWVFGRSLFAFENNRYLLCAYQQKGRAHLARLDTVSLDITPIPTSYTQIESLQAEDGRLYFTGGGPLQPLELVEMSLSHTRRTRDHKLSLRLDVEVTVICRSRADQVDPGFISRPELLEFPTQNDQTAFAIFYPPHNETARAPKGELPPLIVISHGGPTAAAPHTLRFPIQYWTSRGFAVADVDYGGSTGYGRAYRQRLDGQWGVVDMDDCANAARYLAEQGRVDGERMAITGGSAGGYTTLCALTFRPGVFKAGASYYGVSDLHSLATETHKFESRYLDHLVGPYPERKDLYKERSPIHHIDQLACPVIFFQGLDDPVVPPDQSEKMFAAVKAKGLPTAYLAFPGESHGFRKPENLRRALEAELYFYSKIFGFTPADPIEPVQIENL